MKKALIVVLAIILLCPELVEGRRPELVEGRRPELVEGRRPELVEGRRPELVEGLPLAQSWPVLSPALSKACPEQSRRVEGVVEGSGPGVSGVLSPSTEFILSKAEGLRTGVSKGGAQAAQKNASSRVLSVSKGHVLSVPVLSPAEGRRPEPCPEPRRRAVEGSKGQTHKVVVPPGLLDTKAEGVELLHDYGSYALYRISDAALTGLASETRAQVRVVDEMDKILLDAYPFNTQTDTLDLPSTLRVDQPGGRALHLIQFVGPIKPEWLEAVEAAGVTLIHYIANNSYLVWADDSSRSQLASLTDSPIRPFVDSPRFLQYSAPYHPHFKLGPSIRERILERKEHPQMRSDEIVPVVVQIYDHAGKSDTQNIIRNLTVEQLAPWTAILAYQNTILKVRASNLETIARLPDVVWVGERFERERMDEVQGQILAGNFDASQTGPSGPGYLAWLNGYSFSTNPNAYPVVDIVDDGIGNGTVNSGDSTLHQFGNIANPTRLFYVANCTSAADGGGPDGHGHINVSIAGSYDTRAGSPYRDGDGFQRGLGINPYGRLAGTRIFDPGGFDLSACGGTDTGLIRSIQDSGAQIASNSWGCGPPWCGSTYDDSSQAFDVGVRDADLTEAGNQELILLFAAGNSGPGSGTVGTPGNGKNMITVGASENDRPTWTDGCSVSPTGADNAMDVIDFSSRGPSPGSRVKPEVIAPGTHIQGTASTHPSYNGSGVCDQYQPTGQTTFAASSGTSHSTPAVAGVASLYYYWLENTYGITPSPALIKAYLIAHPTYLTGVDANDTLPSNNQGYGMPNMDLAFDDTPRLLINQSVVFDNSGETWTWSGAVADPSKPVRVVLAYTDKAGAIGTSPQVNDLNLAAEVGGTTYLGNVFSGQWSTTGGSPDAANNYEAIFLPAGTTGAISITVTAFNVADDGVPNTGDSTDQDFALVCYNCAQFPDFTLSATPFSQSTCAPADAVYDISVGQIMGFTDPVTLSALGQPAGTNVNYSVNPVTPPGTSVLTIGNTGAATAGSYSISIVGTAPTSTHTTTVQLDLFTVAPGTVTLVSPSNGATDVGIRPTLEWSVATQGASYYLEVATDAGFGNLVYTTTVTTISHTLASSLNYSTLYYWRVTAQNTCGGGSPSAVSSLTTHAAPLVFCRTPNLSIPDDDPTGVTDSLTVGATSSILDLNVSVTATHTWVGDLFFALEHVDTGTSVTIIDRPGKPASYYGCGGYDIDATLDDEAATPVEDECASTTPAISGAFIPSEPLSGFDGEDMTGTWTLTVSDNEGQDTGTLDGWCLHAVVASSDLEISKSGPPTANPGDLITYTLTITNSGGAAASNLVITDAIPTGAAYVSGGTRVGDVVSWTMASLSAGNSVNVQFVLTATQTITNSDYRVSADGGYSATGSAPVVTVISAPDLEISKSGPSTANLGDLITYTLTITNSGTGAASNLVITDAIPARATYVSGGTRVGDVVSWTVASLSAGNNVNNQFVVTATQAITNSDYRVSADGGYHATGGVSVVTVISGVQDKVYLPLILKSQ